MPVGLPSSYLAVASEGGEGEACSYEIHHAV